MFTKMSLVRGEREQHSPDQQALELTNAEKSLWIAHQMNPASCNEPLGVKLKGEVSLILLQEALDRIVQRHPALRMIFICQDGENPQKLILPQVNIPITPHDFTAISPIEKENMIQDTLELLRIEPFSLEEGPLLRPHLLKISDEEYLFYVVFHHIIYDGWSSGIFLRELSAFYTALKKKEQIAQAKQEDTGIAKLIQATEIGALAHHESDTYWANKMQGSIPYVGFSSDQSPAKGLTYQGDYISCIIDSALMRKVEKFSTDMQISVYRVMLTAYFILLHQMTLEEDIVVGMPVNLRPRKGFEEIFGYYINTLPIRLSLADVQGYNQLLKQVDQHVREALQHQHYRSESLIENTDSTEKGDRPIVSTVFNMVGLPTIEFEGLEAEVTYQFKRTTLFDIVWRVVKSEEKQYMIEIDFNTDLYHSNTIENLLQRYIHVLETLLQNPEASLHTLPFLIEEDYEIYKNINRNNLDFPTTKTLDQLIDDQASQFPDRLAITMGEEAITYKQLRDRTNQLAHYLLQHHLKKSERVALLMDRHIDTIIAMIAILKAGGAYVPIDPDFPAERIQYMVADSEATHLITRKKWAHKLPNDFGCCLLWEEIPTDLPVDSVEACHTPEDIAYMIYTSGSTGNPKGVLLSHIGVVNLIYSLKDKYKYTEKDVYLQFASLIFDASVWEIYSSLLCGGRLHLLSDLDRTSPENFVQTVNSTKANYCVLPVIYFKQLSQLPEETLEQLHSLKAIFIGGETLSPEAVRMWQRKVGTRILIANAYGPTEATVCKTIYDITEMLPEEQQSIPIGKPLANSEIFILNKHGMLCPLNVPGEIILGGVGLAKGYLNQAEQTKTAFVSLALPNQPEKRFYRTGDIGRILPDGNLEFMGRMDHQVKIRGYRIELDEIETVLLQHPKVKDSAIVVYKDDHDRSRLVAFYMTADSDGDVPVDELVTYLNQRLPVYMVPEHFYTLSSMPLSPSGKVDRKSLAQQARSLMTTESRIYISPNTPTEKAVVKIWAKVLQIEEARISINDDFFALGGHSLIAIKVINQVQKQLEAKIELKDLFQYRTVERLAVFIDEQATTNTAYQVSKDIDKLPHVIEQEHYTLSNAQKRLWFLEKWNNSVGVYHVPLQMKIKPGLDPDLFRQALEILINRHEILRTTFLEFQGEPRQVIHNSFELALYHKDLSHLHEEQQKALIEEEIRNDMKESFDLSNGPLFRISLYSLSDELSHLYLNFHHLITDEWSIQLFLQECIEVYQAQEQGKKPSLQPIESRYIDYAEWQEQKLREGYWKAEEAYWLEQLKGPLPVLELPLDFIRPKEQTFEGETVDFPLTKKLTQQLKEVGKAESVTMNMLLLSAYFKLLSHFSGQEDIIVGTPIAGRIHEAVEHIQGFFVNTLAIRMNFQGVDTLHQLIQKVKETTLAAYHHQAYPFDSLIELINPDRMENQTPIFSTMFTYENDLNLQQGDYQLEVLPCDINTSKFDLSLAVYEKNQQLHLAFEYNKDLFTQDTISRFADSLEKILEAFINQRLSAPHLLDLLTDEEKQLYQEVNGTKAAYPFEQTIQERFYEQASKYPSKIAISMGEQSLTYEEVNHASNQVAHYLRFTGMRPQEKVAILLDRSIESIIAMLGILKAGGAYVPIDTGYPKDRIEYILEDSQTSYMITRDAHMKGLSRYTGVIVGMEDVYELGQTNHVEPLNTAEDIAYVIYTSGSTGKPKGTLLRHRGVLNLIQWRKDQFQVNCEDTFVQFASFSFDTSVSEIFSALLHGARLHILSEDERYSVSAYALAVQKVQATITDVPIVFFHNVIASLSNTEAEMVKTLRMMMVGGEALPAESVRAWHNRFGQQTLIINEYGPTEATVSATFYPIHRIEPEQKNVPIGKPLANTKIHILHSQKTPCPIGAIGEIYIESVGLSPGYWNQEKKNEEVFISNPFTHQFADRLYRTGDLARWLPDGNIEFVGRRDDQIKIRGYRVELGEIEETLLQHSLIHQSVVLAVDSGAEKVLVSYYTTNSQQEIQASELNSYLSGTLPEYMLPRHYLHLEELPLTPNGKVDRKSLMQNSPHFVKKERSFTKPETELQIEIAQIWEQVLDVKPVGLEDDFFELGGHSLKIMPVLVQLKPKYPMIRIQDFFKFRTVAKLAQYLEEKQEQSTKSTQSIEQSPIATKPVTNRIQKKREKVSNITVNVPKGVFLTGATGFLGAYILKELLEIPSIPIHCLVRKTGDASIDRKLEEKMVFYFGQDVLSQMKGRVFTVEGDLSSKGLGMDSLVWDHLAGKIDSVIHCGGEVRHYGDREHFHKVNLESTNELIQLSKKLKARFHYISTLSVVGHSIHDPAEFMFYETDFDRGQEIENVYVESKFLSEKSVRQAMEEGLDATIYRVGNLVGHSVTGKFQYNIHENAFYRLLKAIFLLRVAPSIPGYMDLTPIDYGSKAIVQLSCQLETIGETLHICNPAQITWEDFIRNIQQAGYPVSLIQAEEYIQTLYQGDLSDEQQQALELILPSLEASEGMSISIPDCALVQEFLQNTAVVCPKPTEQLIRGMIEYAVEVDFFPAIQETILK
ncbi:non-ribosomal peptide synthetase [Brevibacillus laterosporus]|uniref:non-ribosomal peptide synthetase n=1 Tax=Brevibacillus laterosporus TaxID=1465 RepID=UPI0009F1B6C3|nr:non-ribosomal peptide synthetase [Brevibacillus laterosporus]